MSKIDDVLEIVKGMTVLELADLVKAFEEEFGVSLSLIHILSLTKRNRGGEKS